jgi:tRNA A-37 threonylcarbamoyl transferase component Bud32
VGWQGEAMPGHEDFNFAEIPWVPVRQEGRMIDGVECVKASNSRRVLRIDRGRPEDQPPPVFYVKRYLANTWRRRVGLWLVGIRACREFHLGHALLKAGISTPTPLAWAAHLKTFRASYQSKDFAVPPASYLLTLEWPNQGSVRDWLVNHPNRDKTFIDGLARFLAETHNLGFYHDDCTAEHVLVAPEEDQPDPVAPSKFALIDVDNGRMKGAALKQRPRIANLFQMLRSIPIELLDQPERVEFVRAYLGCSEPTLKLETNACVELIERMARRKVGRSVMQA